MTALIDLETTFLKCLDQAGFTNDPYDLWELNDVFPVEVVDDLLELKIGPGELDYNIGRREINNDKRNYFDAERQKTTPVVKGICDLLQMPETVKAIEKKFNLDLTGTFLRIEYTQDSEGFWLEPHTDIGVKKFTMQVYLSRDAEAGSWGSSIYKDSQTFVRNVPFRSNTANVFVPSPHTWHGFEPRPINGIRKSLIINYVTEKWRARHELAFPETPVRPA
ncbi:2OG-Fe(II) oxygenase [Sneathiella litorea]|uniref:2OG-Fe(II) oxygenase n=1 Tax=Sneathiella litorea TaxID=2606216 RepID=A0A6L8W7N0_9PROT|nr:2OG-Fe(II) oxygenase [Sneathiella litorea]MZR30380.1 2OG-Fe(II) oxygenase [Sneathiella litorea]